MRGVDLTNQTFGNLKVVRKSYVNKSNKAVWECKCLLCNSTTFVVTGHLTSGHTTSCGCTKVKHNHSHRRHRLYSIWVDMRRRSNQSDNKDYPNYGGRGIKVCEEWDSDYVAFMNWSFNNGYADDLTIDRKDNDGDYCPENCRWVTRAENNRNKRKPYKKSDE